VLFRSLNFRVPSLRPVLSGEPVILVHDGAVLDRNMRRERITHAELRAAARQNAIADIDDVRLAVLETNGQISFIKKGG